MLFRLLAFCLLVSTVYSKSYQSLFQPPPPSLSSIEGIDGIYVINLNIRPEKWHWMEPRLYFHGVEATRFPAVCGWDFDMKTVREFCTKQTKIGQLGVMMSHLSIYADAMKRGLKVIWVMEDDVEMKRDPKELVRILKELDEIDSDWDVLYTDNNLVNEYGKPLPATDFPFQQPWDRKAPEPREHGFYNVREKISESIELLRSRYGAYSMIVSDRGMEKILNFFLECEDISWPFDIEIHYTPDLRQYGMIDPIARVAGYESDTSATEIVKFYEIDDEHAAYVQKRSRFYKKLLEEWKNLME